MQKQTYSNFTYFHIFQWNMFVGHHQPVAQQNTLTPSDVFLKAPVHAHQTVILSLHLQNSIPPDEDVWLVTR